MLTRRRIGPLFDEYNEDALPSQTRHQFLSGCLSSRIKFIHRAKDFVFVPDVSGDKDTVFGRVSFETQVDVTTGPDDGFEHREVPDWPNSVFILNLQEGEDGQILAFEYNKRVGSATSVLQSFFNHIETNLTSPDWIVDFFPIIFFGDFWRAVNENNGQISEVRFDFRPPNVWGVTDETEIALKELGMVDGATEVTSILKNPAGGLHPKSNRIHETIKYIAKGGGRSRIKAGRKTVFDSSGNPLTLEVPKDELGEPLTVTGLIEFVKGVLFNR